MRKYKIIIRDSETKKVKFEIDDTSGYQVQISIKEGKPYTQPGDFQVLRIFNANSLINSANIKNNDVIDIYAGTEKDSITDLVDNKSNLKPSIIYSAYITGLYENYAELPDVGYIIRMSAQTYQSTFINYDNNDYSTHFKGIKEFKTRPEHFFKKRQQIVVWKKNQKLTDFIINVKKRFEVQTLRAKSYIIPYLANLTNNTKYDFEFSYDFYQTNLHQFLQDWLNNIIPTLPPMVLVGVIVDSNFNIYLDPNNTSPKTFYEYMNNILYGDAEQGIFEQQHPINIYENSIIAPVTNIEINRYEIVTNLIPRVRINSTIQFNADSISGKYTLVRGNAWLDGNNFKTNAAKSLTGLYVVESYFHNIDIYSPSPRSFSTTIRMVKK